MVEIKITWRSLVEPTHSNVHCSLIYASRNAIYFQGETDKVSIKQIKVTQNGLYVFSKSGQSGPSLSHWPYQSRSVAARGTHGREITEHVIGKV